MFTKEKFERKRRRLHIEDEIFQNQESKISNMNLNHLEESETLHRILRTKEKSK